MASKRSTMNSDVLTVDEVARYLRVNRNTVYRKVREGRLPGVKVGRAFRFLRPEIESFLRRGPLLRAGARASAGKADPFLKVIGRAEHGSLASDLDDEIYS